MKVGDFMEQFLAQLQDLKEIGMVLAPGLIIHKVLNTCPLILTSLFRLSKLKKVLPTLEELGGRLEMGETNASLKDLMQLKKHSLF